MQNTETLRPHSLLALESHRLQLAVWSIVRARKEAEPRPPTRMDLSSLVTERFYVRVGWFAIGAEIHPAVVLATVSVLPAYQRRGFMKRVLHLLFELCDAEQRTLVIENVLNDDWAEHLRCSGDWKEAAQDPSCRGLLPPNFYRLPTPIPGALA